MTSFRTVSKIVIFVIYNIFEYHLIGNQFSEEMINNDRQIFIKLSKEYKVFLYIIKSLTFLVWLT